MLQDRPAGAYCFERAGPRFAHFLVREVFDHYYGFGEKSGDANKHGRRLRMRTTDALGYDAETSDPLYKHIPFYITVRPASGAASVGLFYDNLSHGAFDLGQEIDAYHGPYRSFEASDGDLDLYLIFGAQVSDVVAEFTALTGRTAFPPRWSLAIPAPRCNTPKLPTPGRNWRNFLRAFKSMASRANPSTSPPVTPGEEISDTSSHGTRTAFRSGRARPEIRAFGRAPRRQCEARDAAGPSALRRGGRLSRFHPRQRRRKPPAYRTILGGEAAYLDFTNPQTYAWWKPR